MKGAWIWRVTKTTGRPYSGARATRCGLFFLATSCSKETKESLYKQWGGSGIFIPIQDATKDGEKFVSTDFTKLKIDLLKKKISANLQRIIVLFTQKKSFLDPGSRSQKGSGSATLVVRKFCVRNFFCK
jgi:hypothetical protein